MTRDDWKALNGNLPVAHVVAFGKSHRLRRWTVQERDRFDLETHRLRQAGEEVGPRFRARAVAHSLVDAEGRQLFLVKGKDGPEIDPDAVESVASRDYREFNRLWKAASELQGIGEDDEDDEGN